MNHIWTNLTASIAINREMGMMLLYRRMNMISVSKKFGEWYRCYPAESDMIVLRTTANRSRQRIKTT
jgi:hypothetical protein